jgi:acyl-CoA thioesterase
VAALRPAAWAVGADAVAGRFSVRVPARYCAARDVLFGGWAMALAIEAAEALSGLHVRDVSMQFLAAARVDDRLEVAVDVVHPGRSVSHLAVVAARDGQPIFRAQLVAGAALPDTDPTSWLPMPSVPPPDECLPRTYRFETPNSARDTLDVRVAGSEPQPGVGPGGHALLWARVLAPVGPAARLAVLSDHVPYVIVRSLRDVARAATVIASLRITGLAVEEWTLLEVTLVAADGAYCSGAVRAWTAGGRLVAVAEQLTHTTFA